MISILQSIEKNMVYLHAVGGVPVHVERFGAIGDRRQQHRFQADEQHDRQAGGRLEAGQHEQPRPAERRRRAHGAH